MRRGQIHKYNPRQTPADELRATFVARQGILDSVLDELRSRADAPVNQHFLIIGPRGIGKTNLLLMIRYGVQSDEELAGSYLPLQTAEEEYSIASLRDLFTKILELLIEQVPEPELAEAKESVEATRDDDEAAERAIAAVKSLTEGSGRKIVLLVDNLDLILDEQLADDSHLGRLRDVLMNESFLVLIGAAPTYFREVSGYDRPFYNFFRTIDLEELTPEQMGDLLRRHAELDGTRAVLDHFDELQPRIKAVHHLTGGNPRLVLMLYQLCQDAELPEVRRAIEAVLDDITPYYKARLESLSPQQRRVMDTFAKLGRPATPTELARETRLAVNIINSNLKRLREAGFVAIAPQKRRKSTLYMVSERVFRIWHQMRFTASRRRLQFLVDFLQVWYSPEEWKAETDRLLTEYRRSAQDGRVLEAECYLEHLDHLADAAPTPEWRNLVVDETIRSCIDSGDARHAEAILVERRGESEREGNQERMAQCWFLAAYVYDQQGKIQESIDALRQGIEIKPESYMALYDLATLLGELATTTTGAHQEALFHEAFEKYEETLKHKTDFHEALINWGHHLVNMARTKTGDQKDSLLHEAFEKYREGLNIRQSHHALNNWGNGLAMLALTRSGDEQETLFQEAFEKYEAALEIKVDYQDALCNWGYFLAELARTKTGDRQEFLYQEAFKKFEGALRIETDFHVALNNWGLSLAGLASTKSGDERFELEDRAREKILSAIEIVDSADTMPLPNPSYYRAHLVHQILNACAYGMECQEYDRIRRLFSEALDHVTLASDELVWREIARYFMATVSEATAALCEELFEMIRQRAMEQELDLLEPFVVAVEFWRRDRDPEVLDRLNPEVREIVEEIVENADSRETELSLAQDSSKSYSSPANAL